MARIALRVFLAVVCSSGSSVVFVDSFTIPQRDASRTSSTLQHRALSTVTKPHDENPQPRGGHTSVDDETRDVHPSLDSPTRRNLLASIFLASCAVSPRAATAAPAVDVETKSAFITLAEKILPAQTDASSGSGSGGAGPLDKITWDGPKQRGLSMEKLSDAVNDRLRAREWFVTGMGAPELFSESFLFSDPDVSLRGYEPYCRQVRRLFDQGTARCEVICCSVTAPNVITVLWRNSGKVNLGPLQVELKPYVVTTTLTSDPNDGNLIVSQEDKFDADGLGLVLFNIPPLRALAGAGVPDVEVLRAQCDFNTCKLKGS